MTTAGNKKPLQTRLQGRRIEFKSGGAIHTSLPFRFPPLPSPFLPSLFFPFPPILFHSQPSPSTLPFVPFPPLPSPLPFTPSLPSLFPSPPPPPPFLLFLKMSATMVGRRRKFCILDRLKRPQIIPFSIIFGLRLNVFHLQYF